MSFTCLVPNQILTQERSCYTFLINSPSPSLCLKKGTRQVSQVAKQLCEGESSCLIAPRTGDLMPASCLGIVLLLQELQSGGHQVHTSGSVRVALPKREGGSVFPVRKQFPPGDLEAVPLVMVARPAAVQSVRAKQDLLHMLRDPLNDVRANAALFLFEGACLAGEMSAQLTVGGGCHLRLSGLFSLSPSSLPAWDPRSAQPASKRGCTKKAHRSWKRGW